MWKSEGRGQKIEEVGKIFDFFDFPFKSQVLNLKLKKINECSSRVR